MKNTFILSFFTVSLFFCNQARPNSFFRGYSGIDTGAINHIKDGLLNEWRADQFTKDDDTGIQYALDNDRDNLHIALKISSQQEQQKMMRNGMRTYFDTKVKHKENKGVEFPVKKDIDYSRLQQSSTPGTRPDFKQMRMIVGQSLLSLKLFGFTNDEPTEQSLESENSLQIGFSWDSTDVLLVEYQVPLSMLDLNADNLDQKQISIGWKINGIDFSQPPTGTTRTETRVTTTRVGQTIPSRGPSGGGQNSGAGSSSFDQMSKEQSIWTKYTFVRQ